MMNALSLVLFFIVVASAIGIAAHYLLTGSLSLLHSTLCVFLVTHLLICYWEICLFRCRTLIEERTKYWHNRRNETGKLPHVEFFTKRIAWRDVLSFKTWADVWATYAQYDPSFADRRTFGFNVDVVNGYVTLIPALLLFVTLTVRVLPARLVGVLGLMLFWQWFYMTTAYYVSFFVAKRHLQLRRSDLLIYIVLMNSPWVLAPLLGLYASFHLVIDGDYRIFM